MNEILIENASQILTMEGAGWEPLSGERQKKLRIKKNHSILIRGGKIVEVMNRQKAASYKRNNSPRTIDAKGNVVMPGLVDSHTHIVYGGTREEEFFMKIKGKSYLEILNSGNGIYRTVDSTRQLSEDLIFSQSLRRVYDSIFNGTTTLEIKTGYGLDLETELKMLAVMERISSLGLVNVVPTFLGLHAIPKGKLEDEYVDYVINTMMPKFAGKVEFVDVFCDIGAFSPSSTRKMAASAKSYDIKLKMHADELQDIGCLDLCRDFNYVTVDHLLKTNDENLLKIKDSGAIATFLPITAFSIADGNYPNIRKFIKNDIPVAIASDASPVSYSSNVFFALYLAVRYSGISIEEALNAVTINGAFATGTQDDRGSIEPGKNADIIILTVDDYKKIPYEFGARLVDTVFTNGEPVMRNGIFQL